MDAISAYVSDRNVLCGAERLTVSEGKGKGVELIRLYNGRLQLFLKADKCLDIYRADYRGENAAFITKNGLVSPHLANTDALPFGSSFEGGFLFTCGPDNIGSPVGTAIQHGMFSMLPAENIAIDRGREENRWYVQASGDIYFTALFGSKLRLHRQIRLYYGEDSIHLCDRLVNEGFVDDRYMMMYHFNIGYPFANQDTKVQIPSQYTEGLTDKAQAHLENWSSMGPAVAGEEEEVFIHTLSQESQQVQVMGGGHSVCFRFEGKVLPYVTQWKTVASGDYGLGIEPATTDMKRKQFVSLPAGESKEFSIEVRFASSV